jgi:hypothetical protein
MRVDARQKTRREPNRLLELESANENGLETAGERRLNAPSPITCSITPAATAGSCMTRTGAMPSSPSTTGTTCASASRGRHIAFDPSTLTEILDKAFDDDVKCEIVGMLTPRALLVLVLPVR